MRTLKNYEGNSEIFERKSKFKNHKQNYKKDKTLFKDYFIDISDIREDEISINKNYKNLYKEEKFISLEENISIDEDDLADTSKEEHENKNNIFKMVSYDKLFDDTNYGKENMDPNTLQLPKEKYIKMNEIERQKEIEIKKENNEIIYNKNINEISNMEIESDSSQNELDLENEKKYFELRKEVITRINYLNNEEIIDLLVFLENIRPQAVQELENDAIFINIEQFNDDTFSKVFDFLTNVYITDE